MTAVVYSGSKNAYWKIISDGKIVNECVTPGLNPFFNDQKDILSYLNKTNILITLAEKLKKIYVFSAGASSANKRLELTTSLNQFFKRSKIDVKDDLYGAALAACFNDKGIVGILGSGSNCAFFDGKKLETNNFGLGYILGDEGSANHLGRMLLKSFLEDKLPATLKAEFEQKFNIERPQILERVYRRPEVQAYLSSYLDFIIEKREDAFIKSLIDASFDLYFKTYLLPTLSAHPSLRVHFAGTVAGTFPDRLRKVALKYGITITSITKEPVYNLCNYYSTKTL